MKSAKPGASGPVLPRAEAPIVSVEPRGEADVLRIVRLAGDDLPIERLRSFVSEYGDWVRGRRAEAGRLGSDGEIGAARRICDRMEQAHERMLRGVEMLTRSRTAGLAFRLANRAMLRQMVQYRPSRRSSWRVPAWLSCSAERATRVGAGR